MFERFTDRARRVIVLAQDEAKLLNHNYIGTEHLLLGLIHEGEGVAAKALEQMGIYLNIEEQETLINMGYSYFGENRAQVYRDKMERFSSEKYENLIWDFIGRLQKNKIKYIITNINLIHSIDSFDLLAEINKKAVENNRIVNGLIQINVSKEESKTGIYIEDFQKESEKYFSMSNVKIKGFMTMAPLDAEIDEIDGYFSKMYNLKKEYEKKYSYCNELSMGMSNDYIEALKNGATILRIGSRLYW